MVDALFGAYRRDPRQAPSGTTTGGPGEWRGGDTMRRGLVCAAVAGSLALAACSRGGHVPSADPHATESSGTAATPATRSPAATRPATPSVLMSDTPVHLASALLAPADLEGFSKSPAPPASAPAGSPGSTGCAAMDRVNAYRKPPLQPFVDAKLQRFQPVSLVYEVLSHRRIEDAREEVELEADVFRDCHRLVAGELTGDMSPLAFPAIGERTVAGRVETSVYGLRQNTDLVYLLHPKGIVISLAIMTFGEAADSDVAQHVAEIAYRKVDDVVAGR